MRFNPPPNWPVPPGWSPGPGRKIDPSWPAPPVGWQFWIADDMPSAGSAPAPPAGVMLPRNERIGPPPEPMPPVGEPDVGPAPRRWSRSAMMTGAAALVVVLVAAVGITIWVRSGESPTHPAASPPATPLTVSVPTVLILDASGSMNQADAPGPRIEAAKTAALALIDALPDNATLGLETYGTSTGSSPAERDTGCHDVRTLIPLGPLHRDAMHTTIAGLTASGYTPISLALQHAGGQLPADNSEQAIVLVSDGEDTCNSDPCQTAAQLKIAHPNLTISTIGFIVAGHPATAGPAGFHRLQNRRTHRRTTTLHRHCHRRIVHPSRQHHPTHHPTHRHPKPRHRQQLPDPHRTR